MAERTALVVARSEGRAEGEKAAADEASATTRAVVRIMVIH